jgi:23S rRNA pseudouridine2604 synthase
MSAPANRGQAGQEGQEGVRLSKCVAELKACSRREAEQYIEGGWVRVAGRVVEEPQFRVHEQPIDIDPQASLMAPTAVTILLHKPSGFDAGTGEPIDIKGLGKGLRPALPLVTAESRASEDRSGITLLRKHLVKQLLCVPLESRASGLVVFTQDWRVERKLTEDAGVIEQEFTVEVRGEVPPDALERLNHGMNTDGRPLPPVKVSVGSTSDTATRLRVAVKGVHPGLIAYLCDRVGLQIISMKRIRIGRLPLSTLACGQWRFLMPYERF